MCRHSRRIIFCFNGKTHWQMFMLFYGRHFGAPRKDTNMRFHTKLCKFGWNSFPNNARVKNCTELNLRYVFYVWFIYYIFDSWLKMFYFPFHLEKKSYEETTKDHSFISILKICILFTDAPSNVNSFSPPRILCFSRIVQERLWQEQAPKPKKFNKRTDFCCLRKFASIAGGFPQTVITSFNIYTRATKKSSKAI